MADKTVDLNAGIFTENELRAQKLRQDLHSRRIFSVNVLGGGAGAGKTSVITGLIQRMQGIRCVVIEGDLESDIDTQKLTALGVTAYQFNTHGSCHLETVMIESVLEKIEIQAESILFIENIGNLVCPSDYDIGEHIRLLICSTPEGSDKPYKYPYSFQRTDAVVMNKSDLADAVEFDESYFLCGMRAVHQDVPYFRVSSKKGDGLDELAQWLKTNYLKLTQR